MKRIVIIGSTGSGKTTLGNLLSERLHIPHIELDALHWEPNWVEAPTEIMRARVSHALDCDSWVVDGNYSVVRDLIWSRADTIVWLDYSFTFIAWRLFRRTMQRIVTREKLWGYNQETWRTQFFSRDSLFLWFLQTYFKRRRDYPVLFERPEYTHLNVIHMHSQRETDEWLNSVAVNKER
jgi:adenylate kinase family enzyme